MDGRPALEVCPPLAPPLGNPWFTLGIAQWLRILVLFSQTTKCTESMCLYTVWDTCRMFSAAQASGHLESIKWYSFIVAFGTRLIDRGLVHVQRPPPPPRATDSPRTPLSLQCVTLRDYEPQLARMRVSVDWIAATTVHQPRKMSLAGGSPSTPPRFSDASAHNASRSRVALNPR